MKAEDKELLMRDLCARLPYGVKFGIGRAKLGQYDLTNIDVKKEKVKYGNGLYADLERCKPYLRPLSSMTDAERDELLEVRRAVQYNGNEMCAVVDARFAEAAARWYDKKMFDHRGLLSKGLALEMPKEMYK